MYWMKQKGSNAERELVRMFWNKKWACCRVAGSGSAPQALPDLLAGNTLRRLAIECKATGKEKQRISVSQAKQLIKFSQMFGAEPWIGIRFDREEWYFLMLDDMKTEKGYSISLSNAKLKGLIFDELIGIFRQERLEAFS